jgi:hypothetical protein
LCALRIYSRERDEWQITANKVEAHLAISGAEGIAAPLKRDDCNLPDGSRVDVEKSTLAAGNHQLKRLFLFRLLLGVNDECIADLQNG